VSSRKLVQTARAVATAVTEKGLEEVDDGSKGPYDHELSVAAEAVRAASVLCQQVQERIISKAEEANIKDDASPVTVADYGAQAIISYLIQREFPEVKLSLIAEEGSEELLSDGGATLAKVMKAVNGTLIAENLIDVPLTEEEVIEAIDAGGSEGGKTGRHWILDPVDGTLGFVRGDQYAIALAMVEDSDLKLGVLGCPNMPTSAKLLQYPHRYHRIMRKWNKVEDAVWDKGCIFKAQRGGGTTVIPVDKDHLPGGQELVVTASTRGAVDASFCEPVEKKNSQQGLSADLARSLGVKAPPLRVYSQVKYGALARGDADIFLKFPRGKYVEKVWDHAAGAIVVEEAGGIVTDAGGNPIDFGSGRLLESLDRGIVAATPHLHSKLVDAIAASWASSQL